MDAKDLSGLDDGQLEEELLGLAAEAQQALRQEDYARLAEMKRKLRDAAPSFRGIRLALIEVAESFLSVMAGTDLSPQELAVRSLLARAPDDGHQLLDALLDGPAIPRTRIGPKLRDGVSQLLACGVLVERDGSVSLSRAAVSWVRELTEPLPFRMWHAVETARSRVASRPLSSDAAAAIFAGCLGVSSAQANHFLRQHPTRPRPNGPGRLP